MNANPSIKVPANLASATPAEVFEAIAANINDADVAESTQRNYIIRCLAGLGHGRSPEILTGMMDGSRVRLYVWRETPIGDVVLVSGPSFRGRLARLADLQGGPETGFWFAATSDTSKAGAKVAEYQDRTTARTADAARRAIARDSAAAERAARPPRERPAPSAPTRFAPPPPVDSEADEKAELRAGIDSLAALLR